MVVRVDDTLRNWTRQAAYMQVWNKSILVSFFTLQLVQSCLPPGGYSCRKQVMQISGLCSCTPPLGHDAHHFPGGFGLRARVRCPSPVLFDCHSIATRLPHDCQRLPTIATAYLHIKRHIPHPRDQACHMTCNTQTPLPRTFHFLGFFQWQSCGNRWQSCHFSHCSAVAIVWQSCGSRWDAAYFG